MVGFFPWCATILIGAEALALNSIVTKVVDIRTGDDSRVESAHLILARTNDEWGQVWGSHKEIVNANGARFGGNRLEGAEPPKIDFTKNQVLAVFGGLIRGVAGYQVIDIKHDLRNDILQLKPVYLRNTTSNLITLPYAFILLSSGKRPIQVDMDISLNRTPEWRTLGTYAPEKK